MCLRKVLIECEKSSSAFWRNRADKVVQEQLQMFGIFRCLFATKIKDICSGKKICK